jgi:hypothetical protein
MFKVIIFRFRLFTTSRGLSESMSMDPAQRKLAGTARGRRGQAAMAQRGDAVQHSRYFAS